MNNRVAKAAEYDERVAALQREVEAFAKEREAFEQAMQFAKLLPTPIWNPADLSTKESVTYQRLTKEQILDYMQSPTANEKNLRNASIYMWDASSHYRRLITYYSMLPRWDYILTPLEFDRQRVKDTTFRKQYLKTQSQIELMNLKHELQKAAMITLRDGVFYGIIWQSKSAWFVQRINPDYCSLTAMVDGTFIYSIDMTRIAKNKLSLYPPAVTTMYEQYQATGQKWQEVPLDSCWCFKADETTMTYSIPPWSSALTMLYDIETYKALQETATKIANYKILGMQIPLMEDGTPKVSWDRAEQYYRQLVRVLPPYVGAFVSPMKTESYEFEKSGSTNDVDSVSRAEEQYWFNTGTSALLHGSNASNTAGALKLSIKSDEQIMFAFMNQAQRVVNRLLKNSSGNVKFRLTFLPTTIYNQEDQVKMYKDAATLGVPGARSAYAASIGLSQAALPGLAYLENTMLDTAEWSPLVSGYTGGTDTSDGAGRPAVDDTDLDGAGEATRASGANDNR